MKYDLAEKKIKDLAKEYEFQDKLEVTNGEPFFGVKGTRNKTFSLFLSKEPAGPLQMVGPMYDHNKEVNEFYQKVVQIMTDLFTTPLDERQGELKYRIKILNNQQNDLGDYYLVRMYSILEDFYTIDVGKNSNYDSNMFTKQTSFTKEQIEKMKQDPELKAFNLDKGLELVDDE